MIQKLLFTMVVTVQMINKIRNELEQKPIPRTAKSLKK
jgi:hypothetical protein